MKKNNNYVKCNKIKYLTKSVPTYQLENKNIEPHNNDSNNVKLIKR